MPELPEVETVRRSLEPLLVGKKIKAIKILRDKSFPNADQVSTCLETEIVEVKRRAKFLQIVFKNGYQLLTHLKMTGQLIYKSEVGLAGGGHPSNDVLQQLPGKHTRIIYKLSDGGQLFFNDMRVFGWMKVMTKAQVQAEYDKIGPDANNEIEWQWLKQKLINRNQTIKQVIMDNQVWCGVGNIYASEILFISGVRPDRPAKRLTDEEIQTLVRNTKLILDEAIRCRGTTFDGKYVDGLGKTGNFAEKLKVYGKVGEPCQCCRQQLQSLKLGGRASVFCPQCQK